MAVKCIRLCDFGAGLRLLNFSRNLSSSSSLLRQSPSQTHKAKDLYNQVRQLSVRGRLDDALSLFYDAASSLLFSDSRKIYARLFHACACHRYLQQGRYLHQYMLSHHPNSSEDLTLTNHLINMYAKCGDLGYARQLLDEMSSRNCVSWTALISGYAQRGQGYECFCLFCNMLDVCRPNEFALASVLACCDYEHGTQLHALALKIALDSNAFVGNALITMYSGKNTSDVNGTYTSSLDEAWSVFETMESRNLVSWNSMIAGFQFHKLGAQAFDLFSQMHSIGDGFNCATLVSVFSGFSGTYGDNFDLGLRYCFQLHSLGFKSGLLLSIEVATALIKAYSDLGGQVSNCYKLFLETSGYRDIVSWTSIITAFAECEPEESLFLFRQLHREDLDPDWYTYSIVIKACAGLVNERHALAVHSLVVKAGFEVDTVLSNSLIHAYARCGSIDLSKQVFVEMQCRDRVSWNSILKAYALHGQAKEALDLFPQMNIQPDSSTMVALLSACSHVGLLEEGIKIFDNMFVSYGILPQLDHYACMVDILGRAGQVFEAYDLISRMPMEPDSVIWSALLGSCRKHGEMQLATLAADKLKELEPRNSLSYVQMSNIYCSRGKHNKAGVTREEMKGSRVRKNPGLSWIEIGNRVHEFASGGNHHPFREFIYSELDALVRQLKKIGYVPETTLALHDIEEEHKEEELSRHSEKLALVFAIMNEGALYYNKSIIKIVKNIRICLDCHNFMKLASGHLQKEIIVRDSNRFHHFKNRICSCNDYW
uniref:Pentatricopeptide repeat-containing protein At1g71420 n=1 Tax=Rhizophora mucronata TaxID=61149 RepID=A0A2P2PNB3_RHIMU